MTYRYCNSNLTFWTIFSVQHHIPVRTRRCLTSMRRRFNVMDVVWTSKRRRVLTGIVCFNFSWVELLDEDVKVHYHVTPSWLIAIDRKNILEQSPRYLMICCLEFGEFIYSLICRKNLCSITDLSKTFFENTQEVIG